MLKWHSVSLETTWNVWIYMLATRHKRATGEGELVFIDDEGSKRSVWFGDSMEHGREIREKLLQFCALLHVYFSSVRRVIVKLNVPCLIWWHNTERERLPPEERNLRSFPNFTALSRHNPKKFVSHSSGTCLGITQRQQSDMAKVQQSGISIIESISRSPIIGENPEA